MRVKVANTTHRGPVSVRIHEDLAAAIQQKKLLPGDRLPTIRDVASQYGVSVQTAASAFSRLKADGLVVSRTVSGTFVAHAVKVTTPVEIALCAHPKMLQGNSDDLSGWLSFARLSGVISGAERRHARLSPISNRAAFDAFIRPGTRHGLVLFDIDYEADGFGEMARYAMEHNWPVCVVHGRTPEVLCVEDNRGNGFEMAATHLLSLGHRQIAYLNVALDARRQANWKRLVEEPRNGYFRAHKRAGVKPEAGLYKEVPPPESVGPGPTVEAVECLLARDPRPTAILASNDCRARVVLDVLKLHGIRVPDEMSVVGCDDIPEAERMSPALTSINTELRAQGEAVVNYIVNLLQGRKAPLPSVTPRLVVRASTAVPPVGPFSERRVPTGRMS